MNRRTVFSVAVLLALAGVFVPRAAPAIEGSHCEHSTQCGRFELCVADSEWSTWGTCRKLRVLP